MIDIPQALREQHSQIAREILKTKVDPYAQEIVDRFLKRVEIDENGCWVVSHTLNEKGYARIWIPKRYVMAHQWTYILFKGIIPDGMEPDHTCRNRACANPNHLEAVTHQENVLRGNGHAAINARKTHCSKGHSYSEENTYVDPDGYRECRICRADMSRRHYAKKKQSA